MCDDSSVQPMLDVTQHRESVLFAKLFERVKVANLARETVWRKAKFTKFEIPKPGSSDTRTISAPDQISKGYAAILDKWLWKTWEPKYERGFYPGHGRKEVQSVVSTWKYAGRDIVSMDMSKAFANVSAKQIYKAMKARGYSHSVIRLAIRWSCENGRLVMGSPVSPQLFAMVMESILDKVAELSWVVDIIAYADDVYLAAMPGSVPSNWGAVLKTVLWNGGFQKLNKKKSKVYGVTAYTPVLGAMVDEDGNYFQVRPGTWHKFRAASRALQDLQNGGGRAWRLKSGDYTTDTRVLQNVVNSYANYVRELDFVSDITYRNWRKERRQAIERAEGFYV